MPDTEPIIEEKKPEVTQTAVPVPAPPQSRPPETHAAWVASLQSLLTTVVIAVFVITFAVQAFQIPSESMENTLLIGDYLLVNKLRYGGGKYSNSLMPYREIRRGDIIVFHYPINPAQHFVKRVVGVPGDHVHLVNRQVWVNGFPIKESYVRYSSPIHDVYRDDFPQVNYVAPGEESGWFRDLKQYVQHGELVVPSGQYFVMGDNRDESSDSRYWGFVPRENIVGSPLLIYWSISSPEGDFPGPLSPSDRLTRFVYAVSHLFQITRWERTFRLVG